jgi:hypothetical protein
LKKKGFKEESMTKVRLYALGTSTTLESNKSVFQFLRYFRHQTAFEQAEMILSAALDPSIASRARKGEFVQCLDHFDLLQTAID